MLLINWQFFNVQKYAEECIRTQKKQIQQKNSVKKKHYNSEKKIQEKSLRNCSVFGCCCCFTWFKCCKSVSHQLKKQYILYTQTNKRGITYQIKLSVRDADETVKKNERKKTTTIATTKIQFIREKKRPKQNVCERCIIARLQLEKKRQKLKRQARNNLLTYILIKLVFR